MSSLKQQRPYLLKIAAFLIILSIILGVLSVTLTSKKKAPCYRAKYVSQYNFLYEKENTIQIAGVGNSNFYSAVTPINMWNQNGYDMFLMCAPNQTFEQTLYILKDVFKK